MDTKKIKALLCAVELGSFTKAAEELNYTQSGMTHMMDALEKELGLQIIRRGRSGISLTATGERLLPEFQEFVAGAERIETKIKRIKGAAAQTVRVGAFSSMAQHWLPEIVQRFKRENRSVDVVVQMGGVVELYDAVASDKLDCAFLSHHDELCHGLEWVPLKNDELVAVLPEDYPVNGALFSIKRFDGQEFLMPSAGFDLDILPVFADGSIKPHVKYTNLDDPAIISMVEHGLGLSILAELVMRGRSDRVAYMPLTPPFYRELGIVVSAERSTDRLVHRFLEHARAAVMDFYKA